MARVRQTVAEVREKVNFLYAIDDFNYLFKFRLFETVWKTVLFVTPYIRVKRGCAGMKTSTPLTVWRTVHRQSGTAFQAD